MSDMPPNFSTDGYQYGANLDNRNNPTSDDDETNDLYITARPSLSLLQPDVPITYENSFAAAQQCLTSLVDDTPMPLWDVHNDMAMEPWVDPNEIPTLDWDFQIMENFPMPFMSPGSGATMFPVQSQMNPSEATMLATTASEIGMSFSTNMTGATGPLFLSAMSDTLSPDTIPSELSAGETLQEWLRRMQSKPYRMDTPEIFFTRQREHLPFPVLLPGIWANVIRLVKLEDHLTETENVCEAFKMWTKDACQQILEKERCIEQAQTLEAMKNLRRLMCRGTDIVAEIPWWRRNMGLAPKWRQGWQQGLTWSWGTDCVIKTDGRTNSQNCRMCAELRRVPERNSDL
jgi:hypothetical protein